MDELAYAGGVAVDPVHVREWPSRRVMVDIDLKKGFQPAQPATLQAITFEQNDGIVRTMHAHGVADAVGSGKLAIDGGNAVRRDQVGPLAHLFKEHADGQHGTYRVAIGPGVRAHQEPLALAENFENLRNRIFPC